LHDAVEDQGGRKTLRESRRRYGEKVAWIVEQNTDAEVIPKPPWKERKLKYLRAIPRKTSRARLVSLADKLHNAEAILADYRRIGETLWSRFNGGRKGTLWYYPALVEAFRADPPHPAQFERLERAVKTLETLARMGLEAGSGAAAGPRTRAEYEAMAAETRRKYPDKYLAFIKTGALAQAAADNLNRNVMREMKDEEERRRPGQ
jgi:hypothetical protein